MTDKSSVELQVSEKVEFAKGLHKNAIAAMKEWEQLYKGEYTVPKDEADTKIHAYKPARPRAIIAKMLALLSLRAKMQNQVVPKKDTQEEEAVCTRLEQYLEGYQWRIQTEKNQPVFRQAVQWGLLRGKVVLIAQYVPRFVGSEFFPIRTVAPDPATVFEVPGENGVMYFVRESERYALELARELDRKIEWEGGEDTENTLAVQGNRDKGRKRARWSRPAKLIDKKPTDKCTVTEYWDGEYYSVLVDDEMVLPPSEHEYGFCPIAVAYFEDTPFAEMEWKGQGVLAPITDAIKNEAMMMAKLADAVNSFFYPLVFWATADGRGGWMNPYAGSISAIPADARIQIYAPQPNIPIIQAYRQWLQGDVNLMTLPDIAWGMDASTAQSSGFAIAQVLGQVMDRIQDKKENLQFAFGTHFGQVLRLTARFANRADKAKFEVMVLEDGGRRSAGGGRRLLSVGAEEVAEHYQVLTRITPTLPTEKMAMIQQMNALREPSRLTGLPLVDDKSLREMYPEIFENVDAINQRVDEEYWRKKLPEIEQWEQAEYLQEWRKSHKPQGTQSLDVSRLSKPELVQMVKMLEMMLGNPQAFQQALAQMQPVTPYGVGNEPTPTQPSPGGPGEGMLLPPQMLPPQMQGAMPANQDEVASRQMTRGMAPPR